MAVSLSFIGGAGWQFFDDNGDPLSGGKIYTYLAGTTTPLSTFTSRSGGVPNTNPIVLDAAGRTPEQIWSTEGVLYKYVVKTSDDVLIRTWDNIGGSVVASDFAQSLANTTDNTKGDALVGFRQSNSTGFLPGAIARTVNDKLQESVSVTDFGAVGNGIADDTAAIQAAINSGAGTVFFPKGVYLVRNSTSGNGGPYNAPVLYTVSNQTLCGEGDASEIKLGPHTTLGNYTIRTTDTDNVKIMNLKINGNKTEQTAPGDEFSHCIAVWNSRNITIENCTLVNSIGDGILVAAGPFAGSPPTGAFSENIQIIGNKFDLNTRQGISVVRGRNVRIIGNDISNTTGVGPGAGIDIEADFLNDIVDNITIVGNTITNNNWGVLTIAPNGPAKNITITGNTFSNNRSAEIRMKGENITISNNILEIPSGRSTPYASIDMDTCRQISIVGNTIIGSNSGDSGGIRCMARCEGISIVGNNIEKTRGPGIALDPVTNQAFFGFGGVRAVTISNNTLYNCLLDTLTTGAISIRGTTTGGDNQILDVVIENNSVYDMRSGGAWTGFYFDINGPSTLSTITMLNNSIVGPTIGVRQFQIPNGSLDGTSQFYFPGTVTTRAQNLNFDLTSSAFEDLTVQCTGAKIGDCVIIGAPNAAVLNEMLYWGWVSAADTVTVRAMRVGATARNPGTQLFYVTVVKNMIKV